MSTDARRPRACLVTPAPRGSRRGNRVTALRWAGMLRALGWRAHIAPDWRAGDRDAELMVALHAKRSAPAVAAWRAVHPDRALVLAMTGTDLYGDVPEGDPDALASIETADRLIVLHPAAAEALPDDHARAKARVILQSVPPIDGDPPDPTALEVCVLGHMRSVKDPFRAPLAARRLPPDSRVRVVHIGGALSADMAERARAELATNLRYRWLGELPRRAALRRMAACQLLVLSSEHEGGANAIGEALVAGVPILASRIHSTVGLLGDDYPGLFPYRDTATLARLLERFERDPAYAQSLREACAARATDFAPRAELDRWRALLDELSLPRLSA